MLQEIPQLWQSFGRKMNQGSKKRSLTSMFVTMVLWKFCMEIRAPPFKCCILLYYPVDISTTVFSYPCAVQYHVILHGTGVIARALGQRGILATTMCFN